MKALKISIAVVAGVAIAVIVIILFDGGCGGDEGVAPTPPTTNRFIERIEKEIAALGNSPDGIFCQALYKEIAYLIDDYAKPVPPTYPYGRLGENQSENDQWKAILSKNLYSAYADKFIRQAFYVFSNSDWKTADLTFIRSEYQTLQKSNLLEKNSPVDQKFTEIKNILSKYDEIVKFIADCKKYAYTVYDMSSRFPTQEARDRISRAAAYRNSHLANEYVDNCKRLHDGLSETPQVMFKAHVKYLENKIKKWSGLYSNFNSQGEYEDILYKPLKSEISTLNNSMYNASNLNSEQNRLTRSLDADRTNAFRNLKR